MRFLAFLETFRDFTVFSTYDVEKSFPDFDRKVLVAWQKKGYIQKIRNKWYCFTNRHFNENDLRLIANKIYHPSYISMESALSFYNFIPEGVFTTTSVSTLKTAQFDTPIGYFSYRNIKPSLFWGYRLERQIGNRLSGWYKIATPEKAILDFLYLNPKYDNEADFEGLRFNWWEFAETVDLKRLENYLLFIPSNSVKKRVKKFIIYFHAQY